MVRRTASVWLLACTAALAQSPPQQQPGPVTTRATVQSHLVQDGRQYVRLKLHAGAGLPFTTLTFRVRDPALVAPFPPGSSVDFVARRVDGENTLTVLRAAPKVPR